MLQLISTPVTQPNLALPEVSLRVPRQTIAKRLWRGVAEDGVEFGFELSSPLSDGVTIWQTTTQRYVVRQEEERLIEVSLNIAPSAAAGIGWAIGNLHLELSADAKRLLAPEEPAVRQLLNRLKVPFTETTAIFRPGRFARGEQNPAHELGSSHQH